MPPAENAPAKQKKAGAKKGPKKKKEAAGATLETNLKKRGLFAKDYSVLVTVKSMMYGYGDEETPYQATVDLLEEIVVDYVTTMGHIAMDQAGHQGRRLLPEDFLYLVRKDCRKFNRAKELLRKNEEIKEAKKAFEEPKDGVVDEGL